MAADGIFPRPAGLGDRHAPPTGGAGYAHALRHHRSRACPGACAQGSRWPFDPRCRPLRRDCATRGCRPEQHWLTAFADPLYGGILSIKQAALDVVERRRA